MASIVVVAIHKHYKNSTPEVFGLFDSETKARDWVDHHAHIDKDEWGVHYRPLHNAVWEHAPIRTTNNEQA